MPNFKSISFKMAVLQGGGQNLPSPCVCYPKDPMWNRVKVQRMSSETSIIWWSRSFVRDSGSKGNKWTKQRLCEEE